MGEAAANPRTEMEVGADGVAVITIINPPINCFTFEVFLSLKDNYEQALSRADVKAIVITGQGGNFSGGFDIGGFSGVQAGHGDLPPPGSFGIAVMTDIFEVSSKPAVAAMDGLTIGGGLEISMTCHGRISTPTAQIGLPELSVGLLPGLGGTQRLPRLVGVAKALEMLLSSKLVDGEEAYELGLVDALASPDELVKTARQWALDIAESRKPWIKTLYKTDKLEPLDEIKKILESAKAEAQKQPPNVKHPLVCVDVIEEGLSDPIAGLWKETNSFPDLLFSDTCKSLINLLFAQRGSSVVPGVTDLGLTPRKMGKIAIVGGGLLGSGIATALVVGNYPVILKEESEDLLRAGIDRVKDNLQSLVKEGKLRQKKCANAISLLTGVMDYECFKDADVVIEAVGEDLSLKQQAVADLEKYCSSTCIIATSTSVVDLNLIEETTNSKDRVIGAHFFSPAHVVPLLEIVRTDGTSSQVILDLLDLAKSIGKTSIVVRNCTGFAVHRMFFPYTQSALLLVDFGLDVYKIDDACTKFGMPMGPFRVADMVGLGASLAFGMQFLKSFPNKVYKSALMPIMLEEKREGEATNKGFYIYGEERKAIQDTEIIKYIQESRKLGGVTAHPELAELSDNDIVEMLLLPVVNEACLVLEEGIALRASDLDIASVMAMGFPAYRGGIMFWADSLGSKYIYEKLEAWSKVYGNYFKPCSYLVDRATKGISLSAQ